MSIRIDFWNIATTIINYEIVAYNPYTDNLILVTGYSEKELEAKGLFYIGEL